MSLSNTKLFDQPLNDDQFKLLLEKLNSTKPRTINNENSSSRKNTVEIDDKNKILNSNFRILNGSGKKDVTVPLEKALNQDLFIYLASKNANTTTSTTNTHGHFNYTNIILSENGKDLLESTTNTTINNTGFNDVLSITNRSPSSSETLSLEKKYRQHPVAKLKENLKEIANLFEVTGSPPYNFNKLDNDKTNQALVENDDDSLVFEQEDLSLMESDFLLDNLKLDNGMNNESHEKHDFNENSSGESNSENSHNSSSERDVDNGSRQEKALKLKLSSSLISSDSNSLFTLNSFLFLNVLISLIL
jgi:hypothetical protein